MRGLGRRIGERAGAGEGGESLLGAAELEQEGAPHAVEMEVVIEPVGEGDTMGFKVMASGLNARIPQAVPALVAGETGGNAVDAHAIQPFFTGLLARTCGMTITLAPEGDAIVLTAR